MTRRVYMVYPCTDDFSKVGVPVEVFTNSDLAFEFMNYMAKSNDRKYFILAREVCSRADLEFLYSFDSENSID